MKNIGKTIRELRLKNGDSLEDLGKKVNFNFSNLSKIERGERKPSIELLEQISTIYDVKLSYFFGEEGEVPEEWKEIGVEWVAFAKDMKEKNITPEEMNNVLEFMKKMDLLK